MSLKDKVKLLTQPPSSKFGAPPTDNDDILEDKSVAAPSPEPKPQPKASTMPTHANGAGGGYQGPKVGKGSKIAPKRDSSADRIDGRSSRATGRNSRINFQIKETHLDAFKWWAEYDERSYCRILEDWIAENCPEQLKATIAAAKRREELERGESN